MKDFLNQQIEIGNCVAYIDATRGTTRRIEKGTVSQINEKSIVVTNGDGNHKRLMLSTSRHKDNTRLVKAVVIPAHTEREGEIKDFTGYPISIGDQIVCMQDSKFNFGESFVKGVVTRVTENFVFLDVTVETISTADGKAMYSQKQYRRSPERVIVI